MAQSGRMRAAIGLASLIVCLLPTAGAAWAAPGSRASAVKPAPEAAPGQTTWSWLKSKAKKALSNAGPSSSSASPAPAEPASAASMAHLSWSFDQVEAAEVAAKLAEYGFALPVEVSGRVSLALDIGIPWRSPLESEAYDLEGDLQAARLIVAGVEVHHVSGRLEYDEGLLTLKHFKFELPTGGNQSGAFTGSAEMQLSPPGELTARFSYEQVEIGALLKLAPELAGVATGKASGSATGRAPVARLRDPAAWQAEGKAAFHDLTALGLPPAKLSADFRLVEGVVRATNVQGDAEHTSVAGSAQLALSAPHHYSAALTMTAGKLSHLNRLHPERKLPIEVSGRVGAAARMKGSLKPRKFSLEGGVNARDLRLAGVKLDDLQFTFDITHERLHLHPMKASLYGGRADLSLAMALTPDGQLKTGLRWRQVQIGRLAQDAARLATPMPGAAGGTLELRVPSARYDDPAAWQAEGTIDLEHPLPNVREPVKTTAKVRLTEGVVRLDDFDLTLGRNRVAGSFELKLIAPFAYRFALKNAQLDLSLVETALSPSLPRAARPLGGDIAMSAELQGSLSPPAINGRGSGSASRIRLGDAQLDSLSWQFTAQDDRLQVESIQLNGYGGQLSGSLDLALSEQGASQAIVNWRRVDVGKLAGDLRLLPAPLAALASGSLRGDARGGNPLDASAWRAETALSLDDFAVAGMPRARISLRAKVADRTLEITRLSATQFLATQPNGPAQKEAALQASGKFSLEAPFRFQTAISFGDFDLSQLNVLPEPFRPPLELAGLIGAESEATGTLLPLAAVAKGAARCADLRLNAARVDALRFDFQLTEKLFSLEAIDAALDEGTAAGGVVLPLAADAPGKIKLSLKQLDVPELLAGLVRLPVRLAGRIDAEVDARIPPGAVERPGEWLIEASLDAERIVADSVPLGGVHARFNSRQEVLNYGATGDLLEGTLEVKGDWRLPDNEHPDGENRGHVYLSELRLDALGELLRSRGLAESLAGTLTAEFDYRHDDATGHALGDGRIELDDVQFNDERLADRLRGKLHLAADRVELTDLAGELAAGELVARGILFLSPGKRHALEIDVFGAEARRLLFAWPSLARHSGGLVDLELRTFHGNEMPWQIYGDLSLQHGEIGEVLIRNVRVPLEATYDPDSDQLQMRMRGIVAEMASGRIVGDLLVESDSQLQLDGKGRLTNVHLHDVFRRSSSSSNFAGLATGSFSFSGRNVRSVRDLNGQVQAKLRNVRGLPGSHQAHAHTSGGLSDGTQFDTGELRAALARGVVRIERLSLEGDKTKVYVTGTAALAGRLDLDVTVDTGLLDSSSQSLVSLATQLALVVVPPAALALEASQFLSDQVIHLEVTGSTRSPAVRVRPLPLLGEEALRFFLMQGPPNP